MLAQGTDARQSLCSPLVLILVFAALQPSNHLVGFIGDSTNDEPALYAAAIGIAGDRVNENRGSTPHRWDIRLITRFMLSFGLISTAFDLVTFALPYLTVGSVFGFAPLSLPVRLTRLPWSAARFNQARRVSRRPSFQPGIRPDR